MITENVRVAAIAPFWRYAVGPASGSNPAIPYYRLRPATEFMQETKRALPWATVVLYRRCGWSSLREIARI